MQLIVIGYMGSGKTTIGKLLAKKIDYDFIDLDCYISGKERSTINEIFKNKGEIYFRKVENMYLQEIINTKENYVLSVGGGTPCYANNIDLITTSSISIYLKASINTLYERLINEKNDRPLIKNLKNDQLKEYIAKHLFERSSYYEKATLTVSIDDKKIEEIIKEIRLSMQ